MYQQYKQNKDVQAIFCYVFDTYAFIQMNGRIEIPQYIDLEEKNPSFLNLLKRGIELMENAVPPSIFSLMLHASFYHGVKTCETEEAVTKLLLIKQSLVWLYENDLSALLDTSNLWADKTWKHASIWIRPYLDEKSKDIFFYGF